MGNMQHDHGGKKIFFNHLKQPSLIKTTQSGANQMWNDIKDNFDNI